MPDTNIALHPEFGLNATIPQCFWCQKAKGGITPLGNKIAGAAPPVSVLDYGPCDNCKKIMAMGIVVVEVASAEELKRPVLVAAVAPTGRWFVADQEMIERIFNAFKLGEHHRIPILATRRMLLENSLYTRVAPIPPTESSMAGQTNDNDS